MNSGSERCSIIAVANSPENPGVLFSHFCLFCVGVLAACLVVHCFVKTNNMLHPILGLSSHIRFRHLDDFNTEATDTALSNFCEIYDLKNLIKDKTCFKNPNKVVLI